MARQLKHATCARYFRPAVAAVLFESYAVRACGSTGDRFIKIKLKPEIQHEIIGGHLRYMNLVVALSMDFPSLVLVQEIIRNDQTLFVFCKRKTFGCSGFEVSNMTTLPAIFIVTNSLFPSFVMRMS